MHPTSTPTIRYANEADLENVATALTAGFSSDPITAGWLFNGPDGYRQYAKNYYTCYADYCLKQGYVFTTGDSLGAGLFLTSEAWQQSLNDHQFQNNLNQACGPHSERLAILNGVIANRHPRSPRHLYGAYLGIRSEQRNRGLGTRFLQAVLELADELGIAFYGEASNENNARLYARIGIPAIGDTLELPDCDTLLRPIWRPAKTGNRKVS